MQDQLSCFNSMLNGNIKEKENLDYVVYYVFRVI